MTCSDKYHRHIMVLELDLTPHLIRPAPLIFTTGYDPQHVPTAPNDSAPWFLAWFITVSTCFDNVPQFVVFLMKATRSACSDLKGSLC